jgi:hypothetical protein
MTVIHPVSFESNEVVSTPEENTPDQAPAGPTFGQLGLTPTLVTALERRGIRHPFAIQTSALPDALAGRDVLGKAATGSGKTLAFGLPLLARIGAEVKHGRRSPRGLVLVPTRELAQQVHDNLAPLGQATGVQLATVYGGAPMYRQIQQLRRGVDVIIATPGRLQDLISQGEASLAEVVITVLDEADFMADLGFLPVVKELLDQTASDAQRLLFSATLDGEVDSLVRRYLKDPARHEVVRPGGEAPPAEHLAFTLAFRDKLQVATELAGRPGRTIIFARTQLGVDRLAENLKAAGIKAEAIHGGLPQAARKRALEEFTDARSPCSWPPMSPRAASTSTTSRWSCTTTRRRTRRLTCTARVVPPAPAPPVSSSPCCCPTRWARPSAGSARPRWTRPSTGPVRATPRSTTSSPRASRSSRRSARSATCVAAVAAPVAVRAGTATVPVATAAARAARSATGPGRRASARRVSARPVSVPTATAVARAVGPAARRATATE